MRAVFFDVGSTLVTGPGTGVASRIAKDLRLGEAQKNAVNSALMSRSFMCPADVIEFMKSEMGMESSAVAVSIDQVWEAQLHEAYAIEGALTCLESWAASGAAISLISNIWRPYQLSAVAALGAVLDAVVPPERRFYSYEIGEAKPSPLPFLRALRASGCAADDALMVGDSYREDIEPAAALGIKTAWVLRRPERETGNLERILNGDAIRPDLTVSSIEDFTPCRWQAICDRDASRKIQPAI